MADLTPTPAETPVPQLEVTTLALGGTGNPMNQQAQALLNRDALRAQQIESLEGGLSKVAALAYVDGEPLTVSHATQIIQYGDELYRAKLPAAFPLALSGTWASDQLLLAESDQDLRRGFGLASIAEFGAVSGAPDNSVAIDNALSATNGKVYIPGGVYAYPKILEKNDLYRLEGAGTLKYKGGQINFAQPKITPFPLTYKTVSVNLDDRDFSGQWQYWIDHLVTQGADIVLVVTCNMPDGSTGNTFQRLPEAKITGFISLAQASGLRIVMLKPHIVVAGDDSFSRSNVLPSNEALHMTNWGAELNYYAGLCDAYNIPFLCMTCEQPNQSKASLYSTWLSITNSLRAGHPGLQLTAAYTGVETKNNLGFAAAGQLCQANLLDVYGQNIYPSYTSKVYVETNGVPNITLPEVKRALFQSALGVSLVDPSANSNYIPDMLHASEVFGIDIFVTEIGCMDRTDALISVVPPFADVKTYKTQALLIRATMETLATMEAVVGVSWWNVLGPFDYFNDLVVTEAEQAMIDYYYEGRV